MSTGAIIVITLRIIVPLLIFKKNLTGGIIPCCSMRAT